MITKKQKKVLEFIKKYTGKHSYAPSLEEIKDHFNLASPSTAHYYVSKLEEEGYLKKESNSPRAISVEPDETLDYSPSKKAGSFSIPLLGSANAGAATIFADENVEGFLRVPKNKLRNKENVFALRVDGDSMNKARLNGKHFESGDFVLVDGNYEAPKNGDYVVSIIDNCANIKKFERNVKTGEIRLVSESSNPTHKPIYISSQDNFAVNGKIVEVIKK